jgi:ribonuclease VapC
MAEQPVYVLDSYAFMAYFQGESAAQKVKEIFIAAQAGKCKIFLSVINLGEILYNLERDAGVEGAKNALSVIQDLPIELLPAETETVIAAAHIKANYPISYADAFVVVAAQKINGVIMTGDPEFEEVTKLVQIEWLKRKK